MKNKQTKKIIIALIALALILIFFWLAKPRPETERTVTVKDKYQFKVEVVTTLADQYQGLSERRELCVNCGMLFSYPDSQLREFVMRKMNFPLDIIFINNNQIVSIAANLKPEGNEPINIYRSASPVNQVLEINAGQAAQFGLEVGDSVRLNN